MTALPGSTRLTCPEQVRCAGAGGVALRGAALLWPVLLWFIATSFLLGDLGRWHDDWFYIQRVPETGAVRSLVLDHPVHFWRPLYRMIVPALGTLLWEHERIHHFIGAVVHGGNAGLLWWLLWRLGVRRLACGLSAMFFLVFPWDAEVALWLCNLPTGLSLAVMLGAMHLVIWCARVNGGWWVDVACASLTFVACCLNEQPAMLFAVLPAAYLCAIPGNLSKRGALRALLLCAASGLAAGTYAVLHARHHPGAMNIGAGHGVLPLSEWPASAARLWAWTLGFVGSGRWLSRAWYHGGRAIGMHPARSAVLIIGAALAGAAWIAQMARGGHERMTRYVGEQRAERLALLGAAAVVLPQVPIVAFGYWANPRILYPSALGLSILVAALATLIADRMRTPVERRGKLRAAVAASGALVFAAMGLALVGVQEGFANRDRMDRELLGRLRAVMPQPAPGSVLVPALVERPTRPDNAGMFEDYFCCALSSWWVAGWAVRLEYRRSDLDAGHAGWGETAWRWPAHDGARIEGVGRVVWERMVPFEVDAENRVRLITGVRFVNAAGERREVRVPQTAGMAARGEIEEKWFEFEVEGR